MANPLLLEILQQRLQPELWNLLQAAAQQAAAQDWQLYVVGGAVRDLLRTIAHSGEHSFLLPDVDLVVDGVDQSATIGAGVALARSLQTQHPEARLEIHGKFQTAAVLWQNDPVLKSLAIDFATARTESYPYPAANPDVEPSSIQQDLSRRDFTVNAMAIRLTAPNPGELLDLFGGQADLQNRYLRVLHANSFVDDPTRIYRGVRFAVRFGFEFEPQTTSYFRAAIASGIYEQTRHYQPPRPVPALQTRLKAEFKYILQAPYWKAALKQLIDLEALQCVHPTLKLERNLWRSRLADRWLHWHAKAQRYPLKFQNPAWLVLLQVLLAELAPEYRGWAAAQLQLPVDCSDRLQSLASAETEIAALPEYPRPSQVVQQLRRYDLELLLLLAVRGERSWRRQIWRYVTHWSQIKSPLDGGDLQALGYKPDRRFKQILAALTAATLDGVIGDRAEAESFLRTRFPLSG
jgi:tRNA nucleotidyltransferase (CCA-adding enzyme)